MVVTRVAAAMEMPARKVFPNMSAPTSTLALSAALKAAAAASGSAVALGGRARAVRVAAGRSETVRSEGEATAARGRRKAAVCSDREAAGATAAAMRRSLSLMCVAQKKRQADLNQSIEVRREWDGREVA